MTVMVANIHVTSSHLEETISTAKFATRMMKVKNEATVNIMIDPTLAIKRYEREIRDLKSELAMHDTLANRGRVNYESYSASELQSIKTAKDQFLSGEVDEISSLESIRMIKEIFSMIRSDYTAKKQEIESIKRQIEEDPEKFKQVQDEIKKKNEIPPPVESAPNTKRGKEDPKTAAKAEKVKAKDV